MKRCLLMLFCLFISLQSSAAILNSHNTVSIDFDMTGAIGPIDYQIIFTQFGTDPGLSVNPGESFTLGWYESNSFIQLLQLDDPFPIGFDVYSFSNGFFSDGLDDLTGSLRLENINGEFNIESISMRSMLSTGYFTDYVAQDMSITHAPVPASIWLFASGLLGLIGIARSKKE